MPLARLPLLMLLLSLLSSCATNDAPESVSNTPVPDQGNYDMNSWKSMIDSECRAFFDGCNNCRREPGKQAACTRKACSVYQKPRCLDDGAAALEPMQPEAAKRVEYVCADGNAFSVSYREYQQDDQRLRLADDEIMFSDRQTFMAERMKRERSASGEKYIGASGLQVFAKGDEALVMQNEKRIYSNCRLQS